MSDQPTPTPLDDELLSAYLDDELTPDERARVEQRLETDPSARQLLDQLRAVSRAVQELPREAVGEDLRQAILERAKLASAEAGEAGAARPAVQPTSADLDWPAPELSVGRTRRGWAWAGLAVAAALVIMFLQPGWEQDADVPGTVAMRSEHGRFERDRSLGLRGGGEASTAEAETPIASSERGDGLGGGGLGGAAAESAAAPATAQPTFGAPLASSDSPTGSTDFRRNRTSRSTAAEDLVARSAPASGRDSIAGTASDDRFVDELRPPPVEPPADSDEEQLLVVHVRLTPVAFQNKSFDGLLARNGIELEETPAAPELPAQVSEGIDDQSGLSRLRNKETSAEPAPQCEVVLVDAPAAQIFSCMTELDKDTKNYLAVDVEEAPPQSKSSPAKQAQADQWKQYNRGHVPPQQKLTVSPRAQGAPTDKNFFAFDAGDYGSNAEPNLSKMRQEVKGYDNLGRAMRVQVEPQPANGLALGYRFSNTDSRSTSISGAEPRATDEKSERTGGLKRKLAEGVENVQVLFVLCPDAPPTPSPGADDRAE